MRPQKSYISSRVLCSRHYTTVDPSAVPADSQTLESSPVASVRVTSDESYSFDL